jgi:pyruvate dehydrogenase complex dehydrogenase (E1) component
MSKQPTHPNYRAGQDTDPQETREWLEALQAVIQNDGTERAHFLLENLVEVTCLTMRPRPTSTPSRRTWKPRALVTPNWNGASDQ